MDGDNMKKVTLLVIILIFLLTGCGNSGENISSAVLSEETILAEYGESSPDSNWGNSTSKTESGMQNSSYRDTVSEMNSSEKDISSDSSSIDSKPSQSKSSSSPTDSIQKKRYITHDETQKYEWKCDIAPTKIKTYTGNPLRGFFITTDGKLYEYDSDIIFSETGKNYRKIETNLKIMYMYYYYGINRFSVLTEDFKTYYYNKDGKTFNKAENDFGSVVKDFSRRGKILDWSASTRRSAFYFMDKKGDIFIIELTQGSKYRQISRGNMPLNEKILSSDIGTIKTQNAYYCFDMKKYCYVLNKEATAAYDNIAFLNDIVIMYKDDPTHIYDHNLVYTGKLIY